MMQSLEAPFTSPLPQAYMGARFSNGIGRVCQAEGQDSGSRLACTASHINVLGHVQATDLSCPLGTVIFKYQPSQMGFPVWTRMT